MQRTVRRNFQTSVGIDSGSGTRDGDKATETGRQRLYLHVSASLLLYPFVWQSALPFINLVHQSCLSVCLSLRPLRNNKRWLQYIILSFISVQNQSLFSLQRLSTIFFSLTLHLTCQFWALAIQQQIKI